MSAHLTRSVLPRTVLALLALLLVSGPAWAQPDQPMPPPAPEGDTDEPRPPTLPPPPGATPHHPAPAPAPAAPAQDPEMPAVRVSGGEWGFAWRFGGLATLAASARTSNISGAPVGTLSIGQVAVKYVISENWRIPFFAGIGLRLLSIDGNDDSPFAHWGMDFGGGFEYHFRIWRRISPFVGASLGIGIQDASGGDNWLVGIALGPQLGIEYFIGDRLSVQALYQFVFQLEFQDPAFALQFATAAGGLLGITAYF